MKPFKFLLFLAVAASIVGMFMPMFSVPKEAGDAANTAGAVADKLGKDLPGKDAAKAAGAAGTVTFASLMMQLDFNDPLGKHVLLVVALTGLTLLVAVYAIFTRLGRVLSMVAMASGGAGAYFWWMLFSMMKDTSPGMGMWLAAAGPGGGAVFGLLGLFKPEVKSEKEKKKEKKEKKKA
ncbi:MAG: hypothetical protein AB7K09_01795 [Planctomycetota bacterium]